MLSAYSAEVVGLIGDGFVIHPHCAHEQYGEASDGEPAESVAVSRAEQGLSNSLDLTPLIRYTAESEWPEGLTCDNCMEWIVEPGEDYEESC